jgi:hypothetical protein
MSIHIKTGSPAAGMTYSTAVMRTIISNARKTLEKAQEDYWTAYYLKATPEELRALGNEADKAEAWYCGMSSIEWREKDGYA